jgi:hypothetical protein
LRAAEVLEELRPGRGESWVDLGREFRLDGTEGRPDLLGGPAALVDFGHATLEVHARADGAQHLVRGAEDLFEEGELFGEQFMDTGEVEVDHEGAELKVDALCTGLGGAWDRAMLAEVVHEGLPHVGAMRAGHAVGSSVLL